jgi:hypothetical protein
MPETVLAGPLPVELAPVDVAPVDVAPVDVAPVDVAPVDVAPVDVAPVDVAPVDVAPVDVAPVELAGVELAPVELAAAWLASVEVVVEGADEPEAPGVAGEPVDPADGAVEPGDDVAEPTFEVTGDVAEVTVDEAPERVEVRVALRGDTAAFAAWAGRENSSMTTKMPAVASAACTATRAMRRAVGCMSSSHSTRDQAARLPSGGGANLAHTELLFGHHRTVRPANRQGQRGRRTARPARDRLQDGESGPEKKSAS